MLIHLYALGSKSWTYCGSRRIVHWDP